MAVCLLALAVAAMAPATAQEPSENACAPDVVEQILNLRSHADALGFVLPVDAPEGNAVDSHYQGVQRYRAADGGNWLFVTRSGGEGEGNAGDLMVVSMGSRDSSPARLRTNRLARGVNTEDTPPDETDAATSIYFFDGMEGDLGLLPHFRHVSAPQVIGDILALPLEEKEDDTLPEGMVLFFDISDPTAPVMLDATIELDHAAGTLAINRRTDGRYFVQITGPEGGELNYYYLSNTTDLTETGTAFNLYDSWQNELLWGNWPTGIGGNTSHQSFNFVRQCDDDRLFMVGTRSTDASPILGNDQIDVYELFMEDNDPDSDGNIDGTVTIGQVIQDMHVWCSFDGTGDTCNFQAAGGSYVADDGELMVYGLEFHNDGPVDVNDKPTVRFGEFRNRDILMAGNPAFSPVAEAGGPYVVDEGSDVVLDGSASMPATAMPWIEMYDDNCNDDGDVVVIFNDGVQGERPRPRCRNDRGIIVDYVSRDDDDYDYLPDLDNFNDIASAVRWWAPFGCDVTLFADSTKDGDVVTCSGDELALFGSGLLEEKTDLDDDAFGDTTSCIRFDETDVGACENSILSFSWDWTDDPLVGTLTGADQEMATFHAIDGPNQAVVPLTVCSGTFCDEDVAEIEILNVPPTIDEIVYPEHIDENDFLDLSVAWSDPGVIDTHVVDITWGDGAGETSGVLDVHTYASSHQYLDDDPSGTPEDTYYIDVVVTDKDGDLDQETVDFIVRNVDPVVVFEGFTFEGGMPVTTTTLIGIPVIAHATFTDVGTLDTHTATFDWDDGTVSPETEFDLFVDSLGGATGMAEDTHTFEESRIHSVVFSVTDDDLGIGVSGFELRVRNAAGAVVDVINNLKEVLQDPELDPDAREEIEDVITDLEGNNNGRARNGALDKLTGGQYNAGYIRLERAIDGLERAMSHDEELDLEDQLLILALAAKSLAIDMIAQADENTDHPPLQNRIEQAWRMVERGDDDLADGDYGGAAHQYALAYRHIQGLVLPQRGMNPEAGYDDPAEPEGEPKSRKKRMVRKKDKVRLAR
jgi:hypothetical protein